MKNPFSIKDIVFDNVNFLHSKYDRNILLRYISKNKQNKFYVQTPELVLENIYQEEEYYVLKLNLNNDVKKNNYFIEFLINLDKYIINEARRNPEWFNSTNIRFKGMIRQDTKDSLPYLKLKVKNNNLNRLKVTFDKQSEKGTFSDLKNDQKVKMILDINGLWINDNGFGIYLKPYLIDIRHSYDLVLNESSEEDIIDTEIVEVSDSTSILHLGTETFKKNSIEIDNLSEINELTSHLSSDSIKVDINNLNIDKLSDTSTSNEISLDNILANNSDSVQSVESVDSNESKNHLYHLDNHA